MGRFVIGLIVGALGVAAIYAMNLNGYTLTAPLAGVAGGLLIGALLGWRNPQPGKALVSGLLTGGMAGVLMGVGQFVGVSHAVHFPHAPIWMRGISQYSPTYGWLTRGMGGLVVILAAGVAGSCAGLFSAWTGFGTPSWSPAPEETMSVLPGPIE